MKKLVLLYCTMLLGLVFMVIPGETVAKDYFLFSEVRLTFQTYVYFIIEHLVKIVLCYVIATEARKYQQALMIFFYIQVIDLIDYLISYNTSWFHIGIIPVSWNTVSILLFGFVIWESGSRQ